MTALLIQGLLVLKQPQMPLKYNANQVGLWLNDCLADSGSACPSTTTDATKIQCKPGEIIMVK